MKKSVLVISLAEEKMSEYNRHFFWLKKKMMKSIAPLLGFVWLTLSGDSGNRGRFPFNKNCRFKFLRIFAIQMDGSTVWLFCALYTEHKVFLRMFQNSERIADLDQDGYEILKCTIGVLLSTATTM